MTMAAHCPYASNPYHVCGSYCSKRSSRSKILAADENLAAPKEIGVEKNGEVLGGRRKVDPLCGYASNPYHNCTDFCTRRNPNKKSSTKGTKSGRKAKVVIMNTNNVNPSCSYASNPYHQCTKYCSQRTKETIKIKQERNSRGVGLMGKKDVDPRCKYASNPYHNCTSSCSMKLNQVA